MMPIDGGAAGRGRDFLVEARQIAEQYAMLVLTVGSLAIGMVTAGDAAAAPAAPHVIRYDSNGCVLPGSGDTQEVAWQASRPENNYMTWDVQGGGKGPDPHPAAEQYRLEVANSLGLHIYDATPFIRWLQMHDTDGKLPTEAYLSMTQAFMSSFGVEVHPATDSDYLYYNGRPLTEQELQDPRVKTSLLNMLQAYSNVPVEYVQLAGERHIVLATGFDGAAAYALTDDPHDTTVYDVLSGTGITEQDYGHELGHLEHAALCPPAVITEDTTFAAINGGNPNLYDGQTFVTTPNYVDFEPQDLQAYLDAMDMANKGDVEGACQLLDAQNAKAAQITSWSEYHPNTAEGEAELYGELSDPETYVTMLDPRYVVMRKQFMFLLARLHAVRPQLADYFLEVARRPVQDQLDIMCATKPTGTPKPTPSASQSTPSSGSDHK